MSSNISIKSSLSLSQTNTPTRAGERVSTESEIFNIETPYVGMIVYIEDQDKYVSVKTLKSKKVGFKVVENAQVNTYEPLITSSPSVPVQDPRPEWEQCWVTVGTTEEVIVNGGMTSLTQDLEVTESLVIKNDTIINLNNNNIINKSSSIDNKCTINVTKSLVIKGEGIINGGSGNIYSRSILDINKGYCEIHSGEFVIGSDVNNSDIFGIKITNGVLKISGGTFEAINGQVINASNSVVEITGGLFKNYNPEMYVADGYKALQIKGTNDYKVIEV